MKSWQIIILVSVGICSASFVIDKEAVGKVLAGLMLVSLFTLYYTLSKQERKNKNNG
ncbi:MAG: hypothetical protein ILA34_04005 [Bacteroidaceae bacterium]|nr:hypothetical protein [Bacteroidaceae bacterium]